MKKHLLALCLSPLALFGQITLDETHFASENDSARISTADANPDLDFAYTGANVVWDFSPYLQSTGQLLVNYNPLPASNQFLNIMFGSFAPANYRANYFLPNEALPIGQLSQFLPISIEDINQFYKKTDTKLTQVGYSITVQGQEIPTRSDTIETKYNFPMNFGDSHTSRGYTKLDLNPIQNAIWIQHRKRETSVDGWGQLITNFGDFPTLRIHHRIEESDSFYVEFNGFPLWIPIPVPVSHEYEWRSTLDKEAIVKVITSEIQGNETVTRIEFRDNYIAGINALDLNVSIFPNPAHNSLAIQSKTALLGYEIYTMDGKQISEGELHQAAQEFIDIETLEVGTYILKLIGTEGSAQKTFIKF